MDEDRPRFDDGARLEPLTPPAGERLRAGRGSHRAVLLLTALIVAGTAAPGVLDRLTAAPRTATGPTAAPLASAAASSAPTASAGRRPPRGTRPVPSSAVPRSTRGRSGC